MKQIIAGVAAFSLLSVTVVCGYTLYDYFCQFKNHFIIADSVCMCNEVRAAAVKKIPVRPDGLMTAEIARVLHRSDDVLACYERIQSECVGRGPADAYRCVREHRAENQRRTVFYVSLYGTNKEWSFTLCKNGQLYKASEVGRADLDHTYKQIFGEDAFRYEQNIYRVVFDIPVTPPFDVALCNGRYKASATWL